MTTPDSHPPAPTGGDGAGRATVCRNCKRPMDWECCCYVGICDDCCDKRRAALRARGPGGEGT